MRSRNTTSSRALDLYYDLLTLKEPSDAYHVSDLPDSSRFCLHVQGYGAARDLTISTMAQKAGIPPFAVRRNLTQARGFTMQGS